MREKQHCVYCGKGFVPDPRPNPCSDPNYQGAAKLLGIGLLDHIVIGDRGYFSFLERGLI